MRKKCLLFVAGALVLSLGLMSAAEIWAQAEMTHSRLYDLPSFHYDLVNVASPDPTLSRLQLYLKIAFDELQFTRDNEKFAAKYEVSAVIYDKDGNQIDGKSEEEDVTAGNFDLTNSRRAYSTSYMKFDLEPGEYKISVSLEDVETRKKTTIKDELKLKDFQAKPLMISDVALVRNVVVDSLGVRSYHPDIANCIKDLTKELFAYFEIYSQSEQKQLFQISYSIKDIKKNLVKKNSYKRRKDGARTLEYFPLAASELSQGKYVLELKVREGTRTAQVKKPFFIRWGNMPATISDIDLAIRQLKYIAEKKEYDELKKASADEKLEKFKEFWRHRDPSPGTDANEWMDEYYRRVQFTNDNFTVFRDGWKTDMGMIYIIFGPPSDIERHPFDLESKPHEIWYYHDINKQFVFWDFAGFGEYKLLTVGWEAWRSSIRNKW